MSLSSNQELTQGWFSKAGLARLSLTQARPAQGEELALFAPGTREMNFFGSFYPSLHKPLPRFPLSCRVLIT